MISSTLQDWCRLCHCDECYRQFAQHEEAAIMEQPPKRSPLPKRLLEAALPWTDDWFQQMVEFRKQCFWECHDVKEKTA